MDDANADLCVVCGGKLDGDKWREFGTWNRLCSRECARAAIEMKRVEFIGSHQALLDYFENQEGP